LQLLLIRHASNDWVGKRLAGWTPGVRLNDTGRAEAGALAARLATRRLDAVYSSPLERAWETASFVAAPHGLEVVGLDAVGEVRYGSWEGAELESLKTDPLWAGVMAYPSGTRFPGGETLTEVQARGVGAVHEVRIAHPGQVVAVVSHADVIKAIVAHFVGAHLDMFQRLVVSPASVTILHFGQHAPRLLLFNDAGSLPEAPPPASDAPHNEPQP
jgi:probable phosphoglycerate mutase